MNARKGAACLVLVCLGGCASQPALVGAWKSNVQFKDGAFAEVKDLEFLYVFNAGGTMTESSNYDGAPPVPPAYGAWKQVGPQTFEAVYVFFTTKPPEKVEDLAKIGWGPAGRGDLTERITVSEDGKLFESEMDLVLYDQKGKMVSGGGKAVGSGVRTR